MIEINNNSRAALILASGSPRRRHLLGEIGVPIEVEPSGIEETALNGEAPDALVRRLALDKARDVAASHPNRWVLGADTIVVIGNMILGKPDDIEHAKSMLATLSGRVHLVYTGYAIVRWDRPDATRVRYVRSEVLMGALCPEEIADYVSTGEPMDKAGAYAIQGIGAGIVERVSGSYTNVVGLPLCEVARDLKEMGIFNFLAAANDSAKPRKHKAANF